MKTRLDTLDADALLEKNPKAAKMFRDNKKKLVSNNRPRRPKEYGIGLPYARSAFVPADREDESHAD